MATQNSFGLTGVSGGAVSDLGLGSSLAQQVKGETEEERKKRLLGLSSLASPAAAQLLGLGGIGAGGGRGL